MLLRDALRIVKDGNYKAGYAKKRGLPYKLTVVLAYQRIKKFDDWKKQQARL